MTVEAATPDGVRSRLASFDLLRRVMLVVAVLAIGLTAYLTYVHYSGIKPACTAGQSCIKVQTSTWSKLDGIPVALIGLLGYIGILISLLVPDRDEVRLATLGMTLAGFGFSAYLTYREIYSIQAICEECVSSFVLIAILLCCATVRYVRGAPEGHAEAVHEDYVQGAT